MLCYIYSRGHVIKAAANTSLQQAYLLSDVTIVTYRLTAVLNFGVFKGLKRIQIPRTRLSPSFRQTFSPC